MCLHISDSDPRREAMIGLAVQIDALTDAELAGNLSRLDLSVLLIDCGIRLCERDPGARSALARSFVRLARQLVPDALIAGADL